MWQLLCHRGSNARLRFESEKKIRTKVYSLAASCSVRKKARRLPVHLLASARKAIDAALRFKGFDPPRAPAPLTIPFLSMHAFPCSTSLETVLVA